ncbi:MAG: hypothetical protein SGBAC_007894 [Bacillariaceae sp.]
MNFVTITAPTVITAAHAHNNYSVEPSADSHPKQRAFLQKVFGVTNNDNAMVDAQVVGVTDPRPLRSQAQPTVKISIRRRITDTFNAPFEYEMTEAARVVL